MKGQLRINQIIALIVLDDDGTEGIPAVMNWHTQMMIPLVGADMTRVEQYKELARRDPALRGKLIRVCRFGDREEIGKVDRTHEK